MTMKGTLKEDHIGKNNSTITVLGLPPLTVVSHGSLEEELKTVDLPDNTTASGGDTNPVEFDFSLPMHHVKEDVACEKWYQEGKGPVSPTYKKPAVLAYRSGSGKLIRSYTLEKCYLSKRVLPEGEMGDDGEMQTTTWTMKVDNILPLT
jgi:hypothetical protein